MENTTYDLLISYILDLYDIQALEHLEVSIEKSGFLNKIEKYRLISTIYDRKCNLIER